MKKLFVTLLVLGLSACGWSMVRTYDGPEKAVTDIAIVKGINGEDFYTRFDSYAKFKKGEKLKFTDFNGGDAKYAQMLPGMYVFKVYCFEGKKYAFPKLPLVAQAGMTYEVECRFVPGSSLKVQAKVIKQYTTPQTAKQ